MFLILIVRSSSSSWTVSWACIWPTTCSRSSVRARTYAPAAIRVNGMNVKIISVRMSERARLFW